MQEEAVGVVEGSGGADGGKIEDKQRAVAEYLMDLFDQQTLDGIMARPRRASVGLDSQSKQRQLRELSEMGGVKTFKRNSISVPSTSSASSDTRDKINAAEKIYSAREEKRRQALLMAKEKNKEKLASSSERNLRSKDFTDKDKNKIVLHKNKKKKKEKEKEKEKEKKKQHNHNDNKTADKDKDKISVPQLRLEMLSASDGEGVPTRKSKASAQAIRRSSIDNAGKPSDFTIPPRMPFGAFLQASSEDALRRTMSESDGYRMSQVLQPLPTPHHSIYHRSLSAPQLAIWAKDDVEISKTTTAKRVRPKIRRSCSLNDINDTSPRNRGETFQPIAPASGFNVIQGPEVWSSPRATEEGDFYRQHFVGKEHTNWVGTHKVLGPVAISIRKEKETSSYIAFIRTKTDNKFMRIPINNVQSSKFRGPSTEKLLHAFDPTFTPRGVKDLIKAKEYSQVEKELLGLEELRLRPSNSQYKFGVLYCKGSQSEDKIYENVGGSKRYLEFLNILGSRIELQGWQFYSGGLDTSRRHADGTHAIYTRWRDKEIMFHVSTLLPYNGKNQQLERKKHIGNDTCTIIFNDGPGPFDPSVMLSKYNHIYLVVSVDETTSTKERVKYSIAVACKEGVHPWKPRLPDPPLFDHGQAMREFLLEKLVNGEQAAMGSEYFSSRVYNTRAYVMKSLEEQLLRSDSGGKKLKKKKTGHA